MFVSIQEITLFPDGCSRPEAATLNGFGSVRCPFVLKKQLNYS